MEMCSFFESHGTRAANLTADVAVDPSTAGGDGIEELDAGPFFDSELTAMNGAHDFTMTADDQVAGAFDGSGKLTEDSKVMAAESDAGDDPRFLDHDIPTSLNSAVPVLIDFVVEQADVTAAFRALTGLGLANGQVRIAAAEAADFTGWLGRVEKSHQERLRSWHQRAAGKEWLELRRFWRWLRLWI